MLHVTFRPAKSEIFTASPDVGPKASNAGNLQRLDLTLFTLYTIFFHVSLSPQTVSSSEGSEGPGFAPPWIIPHSLQLLACGRHLGCTCAIYEPTPERGSANC